MDESGKGFLHRVPARPTAAISLWIAVREYRPVANCSKTLLSLGKFFGCGSMVRRWGSLKYPIGTLPW